jgi:hypothetical protein
MAKYAGMIDCHIICRKIGAAKAEEGKKEGGYSYDGRGQKVMGMPRLFMAGVSSPVPPFHLPFYLHTP